MDKETEELLEKFIIANLEKYSSIEECMMAFMEERGESMISLKDNPQLQEAYILLEQAYDAPNEAESIRLAKEAYTLSPECIEAGILLSELQDSIAETEEILLNVLANERNRLEELEIFSDENIGSFYSISETQPYIYIMNTAIELYINLGKYKLAKDVCLEIMRLNEMDNTGCRYVLMALYAFFEEEEELLNLYNQEGLDTLQGLFSLLVFYYKQSNYTKMDECIEKIEKVNEYFMPFIKTNDIELDDSTEDYFTIGGPSEVAIVFQKFSFLLESAQPIIDYLYKY